MTTSDRSGWWKLRLVSALAIGGVIAATSTGDRAFAQSSNIVPDGTLGAESSLVVPLDSSAFPIDVIDGGAERGQNLFHSFREFNVSEGRGAAFFSPSAAIKNILARVTGSNRSEILGDIGTFGNSNPNLFLINPNGIIFGPKASLHIGGSFVGTTANTIQFENQGFFSASAPNNPPLLTVNPSALLFNQIGNGFIENKSVTPAGLDPSGSFNTFGLKVPDGQSLLLVGGDVSMNGGRLNAFGGQVELGGVTGVGAVGLNVDANNRQLSFPNGVARANVSLTNGASVVVTGEGGSIALSAQNLDISGDSSLFAGISKGLGASGTQAGDITLNATRAITLASSRILNDVESEAVGKGGGISIKTQALSLTDGSIASARTFGQGDAGNVTIDTGQLIVQDGSFISTSTAEEGQAGTLKVTALDSVELVGTREIDTPDGLSTLPSSLLSQAYGAGAGGKLTIETKKLIIRDGAGISVSTFNQGQGGTLEVNASDTVELIGESSSSSSAAGFPLPSLLIAATFGSGDAGDLRIDTRKLIVRDGAQIEASTTGKGQGGSIEISASESVELIGTSPVDRISSGLFTEASRLPEIPDGGNAGKLTIETGRLMLHDGSEVSTTTFASGNSGDIDIKAGSVSVTNGAQITASTIGEGRAGNISIDARDGITLDGNNSGLFANTSGQQNAGNLTIDTQELVVRDGAKVELRTAGSGNAGDLTVRASQAVEVSGESVDGNFSFLSTASESTGNAGDLTIETGRLFVQGGGIVSASTLPDNEGKGGNLYVTAAESVEVIGTTADGQSPSGLTAETRGSGDAGNLTVETRQLIIREGGTVTTETSGKGKGGDLTVNASELVEVAGGAPDASFSSGLSAETEGSGNGGSLGITTRRLVAQDGGFVGASAREGSKGNAGSITINASDSVEVIGMTTDKDFRSGISTAVEANTEGNGGDLTIQTQRLSVRDGASVSVATYGEGDAGKLQINAIESVEVIGGTPANSFSTLNAIVGSNSTGQGGDLTINAQRLSVRDGAGVSVATFGKGNAGTLRVHATESIEVMGTSVDSQLHSELSAAVEQNSTGKGGDLSIQTRQLTIQDGAEVSASTASSGQGGTLSVIASESVSLSDRGSLSAQATGNGNAGSLTINTRQLSVQDGAEVTVSSPQGQAGNLNVTANSMLLDQGNLTAVTGKGQGEGGANITLQVQDLLRMGNESQISADALATANGGNINIDTDFLIALPPVGPNGSDIRANAFRGNGGRLNITAQGIFGISFRSSETALNDITASSDFGSAGVVTLNTPDVDPSRGLVNLPTDIVDTSGLIAQSCPEGGTASEQSEFIITGRGGLPPNPGDTLSSEAVLADWATLDTKVEDRSGAQETATKPTKENAPTQIVEAQGWAIGSNGKVSLIASAPTVNPHSGPLPPTSCRN